MTLRLEPLPRWRAGEVLHLALAPGQEAFVGRIEQMVAEARESVELHAIQGGAEAVGFFKIDRDYGQDSGFAGPGDTGLRGMLIGAQYQGRGYGRAALTALPDYLRATYPELGLVRLTVNTANTRALGLYLATGWRDTGELWHGHRSGPQHILALDL